MKLPQVFFNMKKNDYRRQVCNKDFWKLSACLCIKQLIEIIKVYEMRKIFTTSRTVTLTLFYGSTRTNSDRFLPQQ